MKYCTKCVMPDTRPGIVFTEGVCDGCRSFANQKTVDWSLRFNKLKELCNKYRGCNGNGYDCAIAVSGGKDSHFQVYYMKEVMKMNPVLLSVGNIDWTETGRKNIENISETFGCDIIMFHLNRKAAKIMFRKAFEKIGSPAWYFDACAYAFPFKMAMNLGLKLLVYGEDVNYTYGGKQNQEKASGLEMASNDVVKPLWDEWFEDGQISEKDLEAAKMPTVEECKKAELEVMYLSYFVPWDTHHNYEVARKWGFKHLDHEYLREGTIENYNQIDSIGYLLGQYLKYPKYGHASVTEMASRWIRSGLKNREEMIPFVKEKDRKLDQGIIEKFCEFTKMSPREFWKTMDKWYNTDLFEQDRDGIWHEKFEVGIGIIKP